MRERGRLSANLHDGYYGGLRISQKDWEKYDGLAYASRADEASRSQQIAVAERILASEGTAPWATCAPSSGLTKHSESVPVDTGIANDSSSTRASDRSSGSGLGLYGQGLSNSSLSHPGLSDSAAGPSSSVPSGPSTGPADAAAASPSSSGSPDSYTSVSTTVPSPSPPTTHEGAVASDEPTSPGSNNSKTVSGTPTGPPEADASDSGQGVGSWSLVDTGTDLNGGGTGTGRHRGSSAEEVPTDTPASSGRHASRTDESKTGKSHTVRAGDTLTSIARSLDVSGGWPALYAENETVIGPNPDHIVPGQSLKP